MGEDLKWPCTMRNGNILEPCHGLNDVLEDNYGRGTRTQGVKAVYLVNKELKHSRSVAIIKSGKCTKPGVIMNFCPFCGEKINADYDVPTPQEAADDRE